MIPLQGEVWWAEAEDKRRPVLVITRSEAIPVLTAILVAPVTRTVRGIPTEIPLGEENGLTVSCVASIDNIQPIRRAMLVSKAGELHFAGRRICEALGAMAAC